jgi:hypothetical protein
MHVSDLHEKEQQKQMARYLFQSIEYNTQSVCLTSVFIRRCGNEVYRLVQQKEIPLFIAIMITRYENDCPILSFDGLPGEQ